eukprot:754100-Hanusia_phi.AAC.2
MALGIGKLHAPQGGKIGYPFAATSPKNVGTHSSFLLLLRPPTSPSLFPYVPLSSPPLPPSLAASPSASLTLDRRTSATRSRSARSAQTSACCEPLRPTRGCRFPRRLLLISTSPPSCSRSEQAWGCSSLRLVQAETEVAEAIKTCGAGEEKVALVRTRKVLCCSIPGRAG